MLDLLLKELDLSEELLLFHLTNLKFQIASCKFLDLLSVVRPTLLYISCETVIPAKAGIQPQNTGFRVRPGMTIKVKGFLTQYIRTLDRGGNVLPTGLFRDTLWE